jgi:hypothetical protein
MSDGKVKALVVVTVVAGCVACERLAVSGAKGLVEHPWLYSIFKWVAQAVW